MEQSPKNKEATVEQQANYEGNDTILLFERLHNPEIRKQVIDLIFESEQTKYPNNLKTKEEIELEFDKKLSMVEKDTPISFDSSEPNEDFGGREILPLNWRLYTTGEKPSPKQWSLIEAHEKGHVMRQYFSPHLTEKFRLAFDPSKIKLSGWDSNKPEDQKRVKEIMDLIFSAPEIVERMSQLKNYFGMNGAEIFTKEHLVYARKHYINDVGFDNAMTQFFQAITPETEDKFIELINSCGI